MSGTEPFLSSTVISTRSMSDLAQTLSWDMLPHRSAARTDRSFWICWTSPSSAAAKTLSADGIPDFAGDRGDQRRRRLLILDAARQHDEHVRLRAVDDRRVMMNFRDAAGLVRDDGAVGKARGNGVVKRLAFEDRDHLGVRVRADRLSLGKLEQQDLERPCARLVVHA